MKKIGLTGVMGAGKSTVIKILKERGIVVLDCDKINADLLQKGNAGYIELCRVFGDVILDEFKNIARSKMSTYIFADKQLKEKAEHILHPLIKKQIDTVFMQLREEPLVVVEVPLLFEIGWESYFDETWVVACEEDILLTRLQEYRMVSTEEAKKRLAFQMPQETKIKKADVVLYNNADTESLRKEIYVILDKELNKVS